MIGPAWDRRPGDGEKDDVERKIAAALQRIGAAARTLLRSAALTHGLTATQAELLLQISRGEPKSQVPAGLAKRLAVSKPRVTDALDALERKGLVARVAHRDDGRRDVLELTPSGTVTAQRLAGWDAPLVAAVDKVAESGRPHALRALLDVVAGLVDADVVGAARMCTTCRHFRPDIHPGLAPHHCMLFDVPLRSADLRVDCRDHEPATAQRAVNPTSRSAAYPRWGQP